VEIARAEFNDRPHTAQRLQTTLTPAQEAIVVYLRKTLLLPLDDLLAFTRESLTPAGVPFRAGPLPAPPWRRLSP
jgi:hypothetical protein